MRSFISRDNSMEVVLDVPDHRERLERNKREIEGFETVYHNWERHGDGEPKMHIFVFLKPPTSGT